MGEDLKWKVYVLICPFDGSVKYVGCSKKPEVRFNQHMSENPSNHVKRGKWVIRMKTEGVKAKMDIIASFKHQCQAKIFERDLIQAYLVTGIELFNIHSRKLQDV